MRIGIFMFNIFQLNNVFTNIHSQLIWFESCWGMTTTIDSIHTIISLHLLILLVSCELMHAIPFDRLIIILLDFVWQQNHFLNNDTLKSYTTQSIGDRLFARKIWYINLINKTVSLCFCTRELRYTTFYDYDRMLRISHKSFKRVRNIFQTRTIKKIQI